MPAYDVIARMPGTRASRRVGHPRQPSRRLGERRERSDQRPGRASWRRRARSASWRRAAGVRSARSVYAAWDGEEPGLLGSTEWAETHADELRAERRRLHQLRHELARLPRRRRLAHAGDARQRGGARRARSGDGTSRVLERALRARESSTGEAAEEREGSARPRADPRSTRSARARTTRRSCSTSAIASLNIGYGGEGGGGSYHSIYDSFDHYTRFGDPNFDYGIALAKTTGRLVLRLANADVLPFEFDDVRRHGRPLRRRGDEARRRRCARDTRSATAAARSRVRARGRSDQAVRRAEGGGAGAVPQLRAAAERGGAPEDAARATSTRAASARRPCRTRSRRSTAR